MKVTRHQAVQVHPVPDKIQNPQGPFHPRYYAAGLALLGLWRMRPKVMCVNNG